MPAAHIDAEDVEEAFRSVPGLLADYMTWPRSVRREICRDVARSRPVAPKRAQRGAVARFVNARRPMPRTAQPFDAVPKSGGARRNAKRNARAAFWAERDQECDLAAELIADICALS